MDSRSTFLPRHVNVIRWGDAEGYGSRVMDPDVPVQAGSRRKIHGVIQRSDQVRGHTAAKSLISRCQEKPLRSSDGARTSNRHR